MILNFKTKISRYKTIVENVISLFSIRMFEYGLSLVTLPYLMRVLGPDHFGSLSLAQGIVQYFVLFTDYGFNLNGPKNISKSKNEEERGARFSAIFMGKIFLGLFATIIFFIVFYFEWFFHEKIELYFATYLIVIGNVVFPIWFFQGIEKMRYITIVNLIARSISVIAIFIFVKTSEDYIVTAFLQSITPVIAGVFSFLILYFKYNYVFVFPKMNDVKDELEEGWKIFISTLAINLYTTSNVVILGAMTSTTVVGYFSAAQKIIASVNGLISPISQAIYPHINKMAINSKKDTMKFLKKCMLLICGCNFFMSIHLFIFAEVIVQVLLGGYYKESILILKILSILPFVISLSNIFGIQTMLPFGMQNAFSQIVIMSAIFNTLLVIPLAYFYQDIGVAISMVLTECFVTGSMWYVLKKKDFVFWI